MGGPWGVIFRTVLDFDPGAGHNTGVRQDPAQPPASDHAPHAHAQLGQEELRAVFARCGLRLTRQREAVYRTLCASREHPTAEQLLAAVHRDDPGVAQATVYNTLDTLVECGLAGRIPARTSGGACRYDADTHEHVHLVLDDGRILDVPGDLSQRLMDAIPQALLGELGERLGVTCSGITIELSGR